MMGQLLQANYHEWPGPPLQPNIEIPVRVHYPFSQVKQKLK